MPSPSIHPSAPLFPFISSFIRPHLGSAFTVNSSRHEIEPPHRISNITICCRAAACSHSCSHPIFQLGVLVSKFWFLWDSYHFWPWTNTFIYECLLCSGFVDLMRSFSHFPRPFVLHHKEVISRNSIFSRCQIFLYRICCLHGSRFNGDKKPTWKMWELS